MTKPKFETPDLAQKNIEKLQALFPNCVTEGRDENGKLKKAVNFELLQQMLSDDIADKDEAYEFTWVGKNDAIAEANKPIRKTLRPCKEDSVNWDTTENLYIEGDNLEVLKLLQESYLGKVKMIYIDPPYNTGNDFIYRDDFASSSEEYAEESGQIDDEGNRMFKNTDTNGRFHSDWCSMIYSRLLLARNLLSDDGVIFISIDDNEVENLKKICNEIFGESNFVAEFIWKSKLGKVGTASIISSTHEYIICFTKNILNAKFQMIENYSEGRKENLRQWGVGDRREDRPSMFYPIEIAGKTVYPIKEDGTEGRWRVGKETAKELLAQGVLELSEKDGRLNIYRKFPEGVSYTSYDTLLLDEIGTTAKGAIVLKSLGMAKLFDFSKPVELIRHFIKIATKTSEKSHTDSSLLTQTLASSKKEKSLDFSNPCDNPLNSNPSIILDFFSGSATTAHAVMQLNAEDGGHRKFIMVQLPEVCDEKSEAFKAGYKNICEIGKERIRRAGKQILELSKQNLELGLENLEKEGLIEKIDNPKFSNLNTKLSKGEKYARELSEIRSLEEVYGLGGGDLSVSKEVAERGNVCSVGPNEAGGGVDSVEHSGGASEGNEGVHSLSENSERLSCRIGNATFDLRTLEVLNSFGYRIASKLIGTNQQNDFSSDNTSKLQTLSSKLSVLTTDIGFRVLKVADSNMKDVYYSAAEYEQEKLDLFESNIKEDRNDLDLLFGCLLDWGLPLSLPYTSEAAGKFTVHTYNGGDLVACFDEAVSEDVVKQIARKKPLRAVFRDSSFASSASKINVFEIFKMISPETSVKVI